MKCSIPSIQAQITPSQDQAEWIFRSFSSNGDSISSSISSCTAWSGFSGECHDPGEPIGDSLLPGLVPAGRVLGEEDRDTAG